MPSIRRRAWADKRYPGSNLVAGSDIIDDLLVDAPTVDTLTAIRIIGDLTIQYSPDLSTVDSLSVVDVGIGVSSVEAFGVGAAGTPAPDISTQYPPRGWLYADTQPVWSSADTVSDQIAIARFQFEIRSMRKIDKGILFIRMVNTNVVVGAAMRVTGRVRTLCLT